MSKEKDDLQKISEILEDDYFNSKVKLKSLKLNKKHTTTHSISQRSHFPTKYLTVHTPNQNDSDKKTVVLPCIKKPKEQDFEPSLQQDKITDNTNVIKTRKKNKNLYVNYSIRERLAVADSKRKIHTITDIDPAFYESVKGRPIKYKQKLKEYIEELKSSALYNLQTGFLQDKALKIEENLFKEQTIYKKTCKKNKNNIAYFDDFLNENFKKAETKLSESQHMQSLLDEKTAEYKTLNTEMENVCRKAYTLEDKYWLSKIYQEFLNHISPISWHQENNVELSNDEDQILHTFGKYQKDYEMNAPISLKDLIQIFKENLRNAKDPKLYFTEPDQLKKIFDNIEFQNLTNWTNSENFIEIFNKIKQKLKVLLQLIESEIAEVTTSMKVLTNEIENEKQLMRNIKKTISTIINSNFSETVSSMDTLKLDVYVKDVYEKLIFKNIDFELFEMMKTLEREYEINMEKLDSINPESVQTVKQESYMNDLNMMKMAHEAGKKLKNLEQLHLRLKKSLSK